MGIRFHPLPEEIFPASQRFYIKRLNAELRDLFTLEAATGNDRGLKHRSDKSILLGKGYEVHSSRVTATESGEAGPAWNDLSFVVVANTSRLSAERALAVGTGLTKTDGGANNSLTISIDADNLAPLLDHGLLLGLTDDDHTQYIIDAPSTDTRNVITPTGTLRLGLRVDGNFSMNADPPTNHATVNQGVWFDNSLAVHGIVAEDRVGQAATMRVLCNVEYDGTTNYGLSDSTADGASWNIGNTAGGLNLYKGSASGGDGSSFSPFRYRVVTSGGVPVRYTGMFMFGKAQVGGEVPPNTTYYPRVEINADRDLEDTGGGGVDFGCLLLSSNSTGSGNEGLPLTIVQTGSKNDFIKLVKGSFTTTFGTSTNIFNIATANDEFGLISSTAVYPSTDTGVSVNPKLQFYDADATPVANRRLLCADGLIRTTDTSDSEGPYISITSIEGVTGGVTGFLGTDNTTTNSGLAYTFSNDIPLTLPSANPTINWCDGTNAVHVLTFSGNSGAPSNSLFYVFDNVAGGGTEQCSVQVQDGSSTWSTTTALGIFSGTGNLIFEAGNTGGTPQMTFAVGTTGGTQPGFQFGDNTDIDFGVRTDVSQWGIYMDYGNQRVGINMTTAAPTPQAVLHVRGDTMILGLGSGAGDPTITFDGTTNDGTLVWDESADEFVYADTIAITDTTALSLDTASPTIEWSTAGGATSTLTFSCINSTTGFGIYTFTNQGGDSFSVNVGTVTASFTTSGGIDMAFATSGVGDEISFSCNGDITLTPGTSTVNLPTGTIFDFGAGAATTKTFTTTDLAPTFNFTTSTGVAIALGLNSFTTNTITSSKTTVISTSAGDLKFGVATTNDIIFNEDSTADVDVRMESDNDANCFFLDGSADAVGVGVASPAAKVHIDQTSATGAKPVLALDQADTSEELIRYIGTAASGNTSSTLITHGDITGSSLVGWKRCYINDVGSQIPSDYYYEPVYVIT